MSRLDLIVVIALLSVALVVATQVGAFDTFPWSRVPVLIR